MHLHRGRTTGPGIRGVQEFGPQAHRGFESYRKCCTPPGLEFGTCGLRDNRNLSGCPSGPLVPVESELCVCWVCFCPSGGVRSEQSDVTCRQS